MAQDVSITTMKARRHWSTAFKTVNKNPFNLEFYTLLYYQSDKRVGQLFTDIQGLKNSISHETFLRKLLTDTLHQQGSQPKKPETWEPRKRRHKGLSRVTVKGKQENKL